MRKPVSTVGQQKWAKSRFGALAILLGLTVGCAANKANFRGEWHARAGHFAEAISAFDEAIQHDPRNGAYRANRCAARMQAKDLAGARVDCDEAVRLAPELAYAHGQRGEVRRQAGELAGAIQDFERALELDDQAAYAIGSGLAHAALGHKDEAKRAFDRAVYRDVDYAPARAARAKFRIQEDDFEGAQRDLTEVLRISPNDLRARLDRAKVQAQLNDWSAAEADYSMAIAQAPGNAEAWEGRGGVRSHLSDNAAGAVADLDEALRLEPQRHAALARRCFAKAKAGPPKAALPECDEAVRLAPGSPAARAARAMVLELCGDLPAAIAEFIEVTKLVPNLPVAWRDLATARRRAGDLDGALAALDQAVALSPNSPQALVNRGTVQAERCQWREAAADLSAALNHAPHSLEIQNDLAWLLATAPDDSVRDPRHAVFLAEPLVRAKVTGEVLDTLAASYAAAGRFDDAIREQQRAIGQLTAAKSRQLADAGARLRLYEAKLPYRYPCRSAGPPAAPPPAAAASPAVP